jgi:hypothetical protein
MSTARLNFSVQFIWIWMTDHYFNTTTRMSGSQLSASALISISAQLTHLWLHNPRIREEIYGRTTELLESLRNIPVPVPPNPLTEKPRPPTFEYVDSRVHQAITARYHQEPTKERLLKIAVKVSHETDPPLRISRQIKRRRDLLYEWLEDHADDTIRILNQMPRTQWETWWPKHRPSFTLFFFLVNMPSLF